MQPDRGALATLGPAARARAELRRAPARSDRLIAQSADCAPSTVYKQRRQLEQAGEIPHLTVRRQIPQRHPSRTREVIGRLGLDATARQVADEAGVTWHAARAMLAKLRAQAVPCKGCGTLYVPRELPGGGLPSPYCSKRCKWTAGNARARSRHHPANEGSDAEAELHRVYRGVAPMPDLSRGYCTTCNTGKRHLWTSGHPADLEAAAHMCNSVCPVLETCREWALTLPDHDYAVYGGLSWSQRIEAKYADPADWDPRCRELGI